MDTLVAKFDPRQPRDAEGQWTAGPGGGKSFTSAAEVKAWVTQQQFPKPGEHAESALRFYGEKGYQHINSWLRTGASKTMGAQDAFDIRKHMKMSKTKTPVTVTRMIDAFTLPSSPDKLVGQVISDKGLLSTTALPSAPHFKNNPWWDHREIRLVIHVPAGARAVYMDPYSTVKGQFELLLDANTKIEITDARREVDGKWTVLGKVQP